MNNRMVGPPAPQEYAPRPLEGRGEESKFSLKDMYPMLVGQGADLLSTEDYLNTGDPYAMERNPLPGMQHTLGRLGWGAVETAGMHQLLKHNPKLGHMAIIGLTALHGLLAKNNFSLAADGKRLVRGAHK